MRSSNIPRPIKTIDYKLPIQVQESMAFVRGVTACLRYFCTVKDEESSYRFDLAQHDLTEFLDRSNISEYE